MLLAVCVEEPEEAGCLWPEAIALRTVVPVLEGVVLVEDDVLLGATLAEVLLDDEVLLTRFAELALGLVVVLPVVEERSRREVDDVPSPPRSDVLLLKTLSEPVSCLRPLHVSTYCGP